MFKFKFSYLLPIAIVCLIIFAACPKIDDTDPGGTVPTATPVITAVITTPPVVTPSPVPTPTLAPQIAAVNLGTAANYAVLGGSTVTNTGDTIVNGNIGLSPGNSLVGFPPGLYSGVVNLADIPAALAQVALTAAYTDAAERTGAVIIGTELGGTTLVPGVYATDSGTLEITGTLTLNAQGNANAIFIFQAAATLVTASSSSVVLINGAQALNVYWQIGSSATLGTNSSFKGNILAQTSITATTGVAIEGRLLAQTGAVTMDTNTIALYGGPTSTPAPTGTPVPQLPVNLLTAANFNVLAGTTITNTGDTIISGSMGISPGTSVVGFPPGTYSGTLNENNPAADQAKLDLTAAYLDAAGRTGAHIVGSELGGTTLTPGAYTTAAGMEITGALTLNAGGDANAVFIFQAPSTLVTASSSTVVLINGAQAQNVFWQVGSSATLGTNSTFRGNILSQASITVTTGVAIYGKALARDGAVTMDTNTIQ